MTMAGNHDFRRTIINIIKAWMRQENIAESRNVMHTIHYIISLFWLFQVIEYLVGDGPNNRYALICKQCFSHNGMALKEEFDYTGMTCSKLNSANKINFWYQ